MFTKHTDTQLEETIVSFQLMLDSDNVSASDRIRIGAELVKLYTLKNAEKRQKVSSDVLATIAANLAGILIIVNHERAGVVASKALGFVQKLR